MFKDHAYTLSSLVEPAFITPAHFSHWFGYYNYSPLDAENRRLLAHRVNFDGRDITADDTAEVGWFDLKDGSWNPCGETRAFNWQQGAMLQWLGPDFRGRVVYNDVEENHFVARIAGRNGQILRTISWPVYGVTPDGRTSISLQFERSYWCRAYHYESVCNPEWNVQIAKGDGIFSVDLETGDVKRIISIDTILQCDKDQDFDSAKHWIEHVMLNPSGTRFAFYHRYSKENGYRTRALTSNLNGNDLFLLPGWRDSEYSHLGWKNDNEYIIYTGQRLSVGKAYDRIINRSRRGLLISKVYRRFLASHVPKKIRNATLSTSAFKIYRDLYGATGEYATEILPNDGHPSFTVDGIYMLTDTYADADGYRHLLVFNNQTGKILELGRFYSPFNNCGYRSDLHPRFSLDRKLVIIDTAHTGKHQMIVLLLDWFGIEKLLR